MTTTYEIIVYQYDNDTEPGRRVFGEGFIPTEDMAREHAKSTLRTKVARKALVYAIDPDTFQRRYLYPITQEDASIN